MEKKAKTARVEKVFNSVAKKYDIMNDLMSLGIHRLWKRFAIDCSGVRSGHKFLDLGGGTGDLTRQLSPIVGEKGYIILVDINQTMISIGRDKLRDKGIIDNVYYIQANAETLPFPDNHFDCIITGFCLRNVTNRNKALNSMYRVLKPGGRLVVLEFSKPIFKLISKVYDAYSFYVLPKIGQIVVNDSESYRYLAESIKMYPDQSTFKNMMESAGFEKNSFYNLTFGIVALHRGYKF
ncbi:ubiquinone/menaquinone biosynthesis methyltransferase ubiE [Candidatus Photodesmus katoptron]|uniref:Ubiquinone/menaquinone biosynthesis C-methyltransferase UbiE n=1 Tax=Candidatus Photodesmus katoptron Akat1 TaxID=1236703 RepID=S3DHT1_9GAMM|nr:ubiquinone/menaquinone biosynthesis methyltransferase [Candidatus Photodesmus katoptron Akat1]KEY90752.1 ubiquinone/menaquinone biosynthesis methyltransferase ubiE [Candidatus Photodesmus katoptron]